MDYQIYGVLFLLTLASALPENPTAKPSNSTAQINSNSVLVALLDSHYTELSELVEKALLLQTLEEAVAKHKHQYFRTRPWSGNWILIEVKLHRSKLRLSEKCTLPAQLCTKGGDGCFDWRIRRVKMGIHHRFSQILKNRSLIPAHYRD